ncbi:MAG: hypothetical protein L3K07_09115, partial [Thermoplasmata archaeon]|nr:hypothetical protein [Thermoplasmata archaeon]
MSSSEFAARRVARSAAAESLVDDALLDRWANAERKLDPVPADRYVLPKYAGRSLPNLASSLARAGGLVRPRGPGGALSPPL